MTAIAEILNQDVFGVSIGRLGIFFIILLVTFIIRSVFFYVVDKKVSAGELIVNEGAILQSWHLILVIH